MLKVSLNKMHNLLDLGLKKKGVSNLCIHIFIAAEGQVAKLAKKVVSIETMGTRTPLDPPLGTAVACFFHHYLFRFTDFL